MSWFYVDNQYQACNYTQFTNLLINHMYCWRWFSSVWRSVDLQIATDVSDKHVASIFSPDNRDSVFLWNVYIHLQFTSLQPTRLPSIYLPSESLKYSTLIFSNNIFNFFFNFIIRSFFLNFLISEMKTASGGNFSFHNYFQLQVRRLNERSKVQNRNKLQREWKLASSVYGKKWNYNFKMA
jgi:hypothetical protein